MPEPTLLNSNTTPADIGALPETLTGATAPAVNATGIGQRYHDTVADAWYRAKAVGSVTPADDWELDGGTVDNAAVNAAIETGRSLTQESLNYGVDPDGGEPKTKLGITPIDMTWKRVGSYRPFTAIDENHIAFESAWENGNKGPFYAKLDGLSTTHHAEISVSSGKGVVTTAVTDTPAIIPSASMPKTPWIAIELTVDAESGNGGCGPAILKDSTNYAMLRYNAATTSLILEEKAGGSTRTATVSSYTPVYPMKLTLVVTGSMISGWVNDVPVAVLNAETLADYRDPLVWKTYRAGMYAINTTSTVSKLRYGLSGVTGAENILPVTHLDGSPYFVDGKLLMTADCQCIGGLESWNTALWLVDLETGMADVVGRITFLSDFDGETRFAGGNYVRMVWDHEKGRWLITLISFDGWGGAAIGPANGIDLYGYADVKIRGNNVINTSGWSSLGLLGTAGAGYGSEIWKTGDTWHLLYSISENAIDPDAPLEYSAIRPAYYSGPDLDNLSLVFRADSAGQCEAGSRIRLDGADYFHWSKVGSSPWYPTYDSSGNYLGTLRNISTYESVVGYDAAEAWAKWVTVPSDDGRTRFFAIGNTKDIISGTVISHTGSIDLSAVSAYNRGGMGVWKADQTTSGRELPVRNSNGAIIYNNDTFASGSTPDLNVGLRLAAYLTANGYDSSPLAYDLITKGTVAFSSNGALASSSSGLYVRDLDLVKITGDFTYSIRFKSGGTFGNGDLMALASETRIELFNRQVLVRSWTGSATQTLTSTTTFGAADTNFHHILVRQSSGVMSLWIDGVKEVEGARTVVALSPKVISVGGRCTAYTGYPNLPTFSASAIYHYLSMAKIWNRALSDAEIALDYNSGTPWMP